MRCKEMIDVAKKQRNVEVGMMLLDAVEEVQYLRSLLLQWYHAGLEVSEALGSGDADQIKFCCELLEDIEEIMLDEAQRAREVI
jgi:hypothetical protein